MDGLAKKFEHRQELEERLLKVGYCRKVLKDEIQAYLATFEKEDFSKKILNKKWNLPKEFKQVFEERNK